MSIFSFSFNDFKRRLLCLPRLHLFDPKYNKNTVKYYYHTVKLLLANLFITKLKCQQPLLSKECAIFTVNNKIIAVLTMYKFTLSCHSFSKNINIVVMKPVRKNTLQTNRSLYRFLFSKAKKSI